MEWSGPTGSAGSLERLCSISLRACQLMNPLIDAIYRQLLSSLTQDIGEGKDSVKKVKQDNSAFTIADGLVQRLLIDVLFSRVAFRDVVGEEEGGEHRDGESDDNDESWFQVDELSVPHDFRPLLLSTKSEIKSLAAEYLLSSPNYERLTVFIDPIDGTREFSTGKGEQCTVCIGFADEHGKSVGGVVYRPLSTPEPTWVAGTKSEGYAAFYFGEKQIDKGITDGKKGGLLTTNGSISSFVKSLMKELQFNRVKSGGAGNKMMLLLENQISRNGSLLYIQDRGVSRWDSCAAEACLESFGGKLMKLTHLIDSSESRDCGDNEHNAGCYTYLASVANLDFIPGRSNLTKYNCRAPCIELQPDQKAIHTDQVKPYANLCGLVAIGKEWNTDMGITQLRKAIQKAAMENPPSFD